MNAAYFLQISVLQLLILPCSVNSPVCQMAFLLHVFPPPLHAGLAKCQHVFWSVWSYPCAPPLTRWLLPLGTQKVQDYNLLCNGGILLTLLSIPSHLFFLSFFFSQEINISIPASHPTIYVENGLKQIEKLSEGKQRNWKTDIKCDNVSLAKNGLWINLQWGKFVKSFESFSN